MKRKNITYLFLICVAIAVAGCRHSVTNTDGPAKMTPTDNPETPFMLEGDYTPDTGVMYKVIIGCDTCFVVVDSISDGHIHGYYYRLESGSDCVERKEFTQDSHWKKKRKDAIVYIYEEPEYHAVNDSLYRLPQYKSAVIQNIEYGQALGFWCSKPNTDDDSYMKILSEGILKGIFRTTQSLKMDIYHPEIEDIDEHRLPLLMLMHGGAFYVGDKGDSLISGLCRHFASLGYIAVSINYRLGFTPSKNEISRSGYMALQDAHAAMRYLVEHADNFGIDTTRIFVGGASAGSITALNLAFMRNKDRPKAAFNNRLRDLGPIEASGNSCHATFHIQAVINMWGALTNLNMLKNGKTNIISFHGDADQVVPYDNGYPFSDISAKLGQKLFDRMYGSLQIDRRAKELGLCSELHTFEGQGHSLHHYSDGSWNQQNFESIRDKATAFLYREIAGKQPVIEDDRNDPRHFIIADDEVSEVSWKVEGGFIVSLPSNGNEIWVVWDDNAPKHTLYASGLNGRALGFNISYEVKG